MKEKKNNTFKSSLAFIEVIEGRGKLKMPKSLSLNAVEIDYIFFLTHTLYIANTVPSLLFPSFEPQTGFPTDTLKTLLKVRGREALTSPNTSVL